MEVELVFEMEAVEVEVQQVVLELHLMKMLKEVLPVVSESCSGLGHELVWQVEYLSFSLAALVNRSVGGSLWRRRI